MATIFAPNANRTQAKFASDALLFVCAARKMPEMADKLRHYLREWRKYRHLNQTAVAERIGRDVSTVSRLETGEIKITQEILELMAFALGVDDPRDLLFPPPDHPEAQIIDLLRHLKGGKQKQAVRLLRAMLEEDVA